MLMLLISLPVLLDNKILQTKRHKEPGKNTEETNRCMRPERSKKWPNSTIARRRRRKKKEEKKKKKKRRREKRKKKKKKTTTTTTTTMMMMMMMIFLE